MSNKRYIVTITEVSIERVESGGEWGRVRSEAEATRTGEREYGNIPICEQVKRVERELFKQNTDTLDVSLVIKSVNGL
jgi:hypothetical protein